MDTSMEPITHFLTGACIGRAGLNRKTAYATLAAVLAAEAADIDILWGFAGPVEELKHHRGITHTFVAVPVVAAAALGIAWLYHRWRMHRLVRKAKSAPPTEPGAPGRPAPQPVRWLWVYIAAFISASSHILLDWTNNYGVRPFFPFNPRWYAGSFVFIAEPALWALLLSALIFPGLFGLMEREISSRRSPFRGRGWATFALIGMALTWCVRYVEHGQAHRDLGPGAVRGIDPPKVPPNREWTTVEFSDLRFAYDFRGTGKSSGPPPLSGYVYIVDGHDDAGEAMGGREQK